MTNSLPTQDLGREMQRLRGMLATRDVSRARARAAVDHELWSKDSRFRRVFEASGRGGTIADGSGSGHLLDLNEALSRIVGFRRKRLIRTRFSDLTHPPDIAKNLELYRQATSGRRDRYQMFKRYVRRDGALRSVNLSALVLSDRDRKPCYVVGVIDPIHWVHEPDGVVRVCAFCERARSVSGHWLPTDLIHRVSRDRISHGICDDCMRREYPDHEQK